MKHLFALLAVILLPAFHVLALTGSWRGDLNFGQTKIPIVFNFTETKDGTTHSTLDSPLQGTEGIPIDVMPCQPIPYRSHAATGEASGYGEITEKVCH